MIISLITILFFINIQIATSYSQETVTFEKSLNDFLQNDARLSNVLASVSVRSATTGELIYNYNGDTLLRPASNLKLLTAASALSALGKEYTFSTEIYTDGKLKGKNLKGNLYIKGKGDPALLRSDIDQIVHILKKQGIEKIHGDLIADDSWYDDVRYSIDLPWSDETMGYGAQISALTFAAKKHHDPGTVIVKVQPGKSVGKKALVTVEPHTEKIKIINETITVTEKGQNTLTINREHGTNTIVINGEILLNDEMIENSISVWEPTDFTLYLFKLSLKDHGIKLTEKMKRGATPTEATMLTKHSSKPLSQLIVPLMKLSNNAYAEMFTKEMGKKIHWEGNWEKGLEVIGAELEKLGLDPNQLFLRDGSGISHVNLISTNQISKLLYEIQRQEWFPLFFDSLPVAGSEDELEGGTLRYRLKGTSTYRNVHAKTGTLTTVSSISGYTKTKAGEILTFSIILNNLIDDYSGKSIEDQIVTILTK
ncbi:D-alanyl-D-alanine carboxypeptidase/D-alanyl-D-alanine-endopeptidase [Anaerobacillus arseniciselenatis]|uniref:D-alanyl-D-alanine carboxypeptidase/D-alanyl-D-alanine-endopeptidase n=1 Tax=Anaerobacillus arseniciselenatis TaxID=85682 RepID=A0A1S2LKG9_9BACI|nr:D-alanyl-D-alanine carboxypeptidase/D-alanyl-D-alanine-endopeptidase [Anaerobacillus arseniciselenatis]